MKCFVLVLLAIAAVHASNNILNLDPKYGPLSLMLGRREPLPPARNPNAKRQVTQGTITQQLDHFDEDDESFTQRFFVSYEHYNGYDGPVFILCGGEFPASESWLEGGFMYELAEEFGAAMFHLEHRFFGESFPQGRVDDLDTLQYLTTEQALYDLAFFIDQIRFVVPQFDDDPIVLVGTGLGGSLTTWFQKDYHYFINGAWASSAPLQAEFDYYSSMEVIGSVLRHRGGQECYDRVRDGFYELEELFDSGNYAAVRSEFEICDGVNIESQHGKWIFVDILANEFGAIVQYADQEGLMNAVCTVIEQADTDVEALANFQEFIFGDSCLNFDYESTVNMLSQIDSGDMNQRTARVSMYEHCHEFGWFPTSGSDNHPFGSRDSFPAQLYYDLCEAVFGVTEEEINANMERFNEDFGGLDPPVYDMFLTQGRYDGWMRPAGAQYDLSDDAEAHVIEHAGFMQDMYTFHLMDNPEDLYRTQERIRDSVEEWINEPTRNKNSNFL